MSSAYFFVIDVRAFNNCTKLVDVEDKKDDITPILVGLLIWWESAAL
jgi:hypothetical protein